MVEAVRLLEGHCVEVMRDLDADSFDAIVTDPPYALTSASRNGSPRQLDPETPYGRTRLGGRGFMGKTWDTGAVAFDPATWGEVLRVLKPGGHLLAFGGTRTFHRLTCAIEDAGFEIRDCLSWLYGSGFPKSLDVSKSIDRQRHERDDVLRVAAWVREARDAAGVTNAGIDAAFGFNGMAGHWTSSGSQAAIPTLDQVPKLLGILGLGLDDVPGDVRDLLWTLNGNKGQPGAAWFAREVTAKRLDGAGNGSVVGLGSKRSMATAFDVTAPATDDARQWQGFGTALKPAFEPIILARKPLSEKNVAANVLRWGTGAINVDGCRIGTEGEQLQGSTVGHDIRGGRYASGHRRNPGDLADYTQHTSGRWPANLILGCACDTDMHEPGCAVAMLDAQSGKTTSGAMRRTVEAYDGQSVTGMLRGRSGPENQHADTGGASRFFYCSKAATSERNIGGANGHPTVKPVELMRWLCRLVTPPGGRILDPFCGSGSTLIAALREGFSCVGIEQDPAYIEIARRRIEGDAPLFNRVSA